MADSKEMIVRTSPLTSTQKDRLAQVQKFLVNIADPATGVPTARFGYDDVEHRLGWSLWRAAAGMDRPLSHALSQVEQMVALSAPSASSVRFVALDEFENKWFVRVQNAIDRFVAASSREALSKAFFADMRQQPLGPAVVGSVERFLARYEDLRKSDVEGVKEAVESLQKKGLTEELLSEVAALVKAFKAEPSPLADPPPSAEAIEAANQAQLAAFEKLNAWYIDWADLFRQEVGYHAAIRLGITAVKGGRTKKAEEPVSSEA
jgi:hypothetical protein